MRARSIYFATALGGMAMFLAALFPLSNSDAYGHLAQGRQIWELGYVPLLDFFSYWKAEPQAWHNYEWGSDIVLWSLYHWGGANAVVVAKLFLLLGFVWLLFRLASYRSENPAATAWLTAILLIIALPAARVRLSERPHLFGYFFAAALLCLLSMLLNDKASKKQVGLGYAAITVLHLVWVNLHGSHLLGPLLAGAHLLAGVNRAWVWKRILPVLGLQVLASCVSPYGPKILLDAIEHVLRPEYRELVSEWAKDSVGYSRWHQNSVYGFMALAAVLSPAMWRGSLLSRARLISVSILAVMAFRSLRFHAPFVLLSAGLLAPTLASWIKKTFPSYHRPVYLSAALASAVFATLVIVNVPPNLGFGLGRRENLLPAATGRYLSRRLKHAQVLAGIDDAWYLMFAMPTAKFLVDGRVPFYGAAFVSEVAASFATPAALEQLLYRYPSTNTIVTEFAADAQVAATQALLQHPDWQLVNIENHHAAFVRKSLSTGLRDLTRLQPLYDAAWVLDSQTSTGAIRRELDALGHDPNNRLYKSWVSALLLLRPLAREGARAGFRAPVNQTERDAAHKAMALLGKVSDAMYYFPIVHLHRAMASLAACELEQVPAALKRARLEGDNREALLTEMEWMLRAGQTEEVRARIKQAMNMPGLKSDPWLLALSSQIDLPSPCK
ncbi:MAG: hypothetical protein IPJ88_12055 [Myxococcales bacterium]|nr:MAG: hypothetical protein IPJ88_12055 [Myxococcales bacterium]